jgi:hypothetical protein
MVATRECYISHNSEGKFTFNFKRELNQCIIMCFISFFALAQVNFWVNGGWDQPNCGFVVNPLFILQLSEAQGVEGKSINVTSKCTIMLQHL